MIEEDISKADKSRMDRTNNIDSVYVMLALVNTFHTEQTLAFPKELLSLFAGRKVSSKILPSSEARQPVTANSKSPGVGLPIST